MTKSTQVSQTTISGNLNSATPANTWSGVSAPWTKPTLTKDPEYVFETLREAKHSQNTFGERIKRCQAELMEMHKQGELAEYVDDKNSDKYNGPGVSVTLCRGRVKRTWDSEVQEQLDKLQKEMKRIEQLAERAEKYTEERGEDYWRMTLTGEL